MKIVQVIYALSSGGAERLVVDLSNQLARMGHEVVVLTLVDDKRPGCSFYKAELSNEVAYINLGYGRMVPGVAWRVYKTLKQLRPDVVHMHLSNIRLVCLLSMLLLRKPLYVATCHNQAEREMGGSWVPWLVRSIYRHGLHKLIAISQANAASIERCYGRPATRLIYNGRAKTPTTDLLADTRARIAKMKRHRYDVVFINIARCQPQKNHLRLLKAFNRLVAEGAHATLLILGAGYDSEYGKQLQAQAGEDVHFLGEQHNVSDWLSEADMFALSSDFEGMPITLIEALANGCIPVGTPVSGIIDLVQDGKTGFVAGDFSDEAFFQTLQRAYLHHKEIDKDTLRLIYEQQLSIEQCARQYVEVYKKV